MSRLYLFMILLALALGSCRPTEQSVPTSIDIPLAGDYYYSAWISDREVVSIDSDHTIWIFDPENLNIRKLPISSDPACGETRYLYPHRLPDGRLGLIKECLSATTNNDSPGKDQRYMLAYDLNTGEIEHIVKSSLPSSHLSGRYSWNPDMSRGIQLATNQLTGYLYWLSPNGSAPIQAEITDGNRSWSLASNPFDLSQDAQSSFGLPGEASWSPNGEKIAFWGSIDAIGNGGQSRADEVWNLYSIDPDESKLQILLEGIYHPHLLEWSPDNDWLAFYGERGTLRDKGIWIFNPSTTELRKIADIQFLQDLSWSPNGESIILNLCNDISCSNTQFKIISLPRY